MMFHFIGGYFSTENETLIVSNLAWHGVTSWIILMQILIKTAYKRVIYLLGREIVRGSISWSYLVA